jgi:LysR family glycine cleavage system transcriptional activator
MIFEFRFRKSNVNNLPLQALFYFYRAAERGSFKLAAEELFVTPGALSQQIRLLEERLDTTLFHRQHRKVVLSPDGQRLLPYAREAFSSLQEGLKQIGKDPNPSTLHLSTLSSFGQQWLVPRLSDLQQHSPEFSIALNPSEKLVDFQTESVDLAIRFGGGNYPGLQTEFLMHDYLYPVVHPMFLERHPIKTPEDLCQCHLLEDTQHDMSWAAWLAAIDCTVPLSQSSIQYSGVHFVIEGALAVQGVALVRHSVASRYVEQGTLVRLFDHAIVSPFSYWLCAPPSHFRRDKVVAFSSWIQSAISVFTSSEFFPGSNLK